MENPESKPPSSTPSTNDLNFDPPVTKVACPSTPSSTHLMDSLDSSAPASETPAKKGRGRPPGSEKQKQPETSGHCI